MNDIRLKKGLLQLADQGWFVAKITDEFVESLLGGGTTGTRLRV